MSFISVTVSYRRRRMNQHTDACKTLQTLSHWLYETASACKSCSGSLWTIYFLQKVLVSYSSRKLSHNLCSMWLHLVYVCIIFFCLYQCMQVILTKFFQYCVSQYISAVKLCQLSRQNCLPSLCMCRVHDGFIVLYMAPQTEICM